MFVLYASGIWTKSNGPNYTKLWAFWQKNKTKQNETKKTKTKTKQKQNKTKHNKTKQKQKQKQKQNKKSKTKNPVFKNHFKQSADDILEDVFVAETIFNAKILMARLRSFSVPKK